jgi:hypothetical protein
MSQIITKRKIPSQDFVASTMCLSALLIPENQVSLFKFWQDDELRDGLRYKSELFYLTHRFNSYQKDNVLEVAQELMGHGVEVIVTCSTDNYKIWTSLQALSQPSNCASNCS